MKYLTKEDFQKSLLIFSRRHLEDLNGILNRLRVFYGSYRQNKLSVSSVPNKQDIEKMTNLLIDIVKFVYQGTMLENEEVIKYCYLNGNCDYFVGAICAVYEKHLGIKPVHSSRFPTVDGNEIYMLPVGRSFNFLPEKEKKDTLYIIGFGWEEKVKKFKEKQPYTYHRALYMNGEYFDICGGKNKIEFKKHLEKCFQAQTDKMFKTVANIGYDIFTQFLVKCVEVDNIKIMNKADSANCELLKKA